MRIKSVEAKLYQAPLNGVYTIALGSSTRAEAVIIRIRTEGGLTGLGEAAPSPPVTGANAEATLGFLRDLAPALQNCDASDLSGIHAIMDRRSAGHGAARAGVDMALYDILSQRAGLPLYRFLGGSNPRVQTDMTVTIDSTRVMAARAKSFVENGFRILKVKAGLDPIEDIEHLRAIREAAGPEVELRIDANQGWNEKTTLWALEKMADLGIVEVEQPLPFWNLEGMRFVRDRITQPLMLDESVHSPVDALKAVRAGAGDIINIKLMKCGGIYKAQKINAIAEAAGLSCMVGCMTETHIAIAAGAHLAAALPNVKLADLDGFLEIRDEGCARGGFTREGDILTLGAEPGLGVSVDFDAL
jgi:L-alanine-DL-glutamate epimerase-like enolase superfamily enzyme